MRGFAVIAVLTSRAGAVAGGKQTDLGRPRGTDARADRRVRHRQGAAAALAASRWSSTPRTGTTRTSGRRSARESGPAARTGDLVQITKIDIDDDKLVLQINGGFKGGRKWYQGVQIGMGGSTAPVSHE